ncbi:MAG: hypothetical protein OEZ43_10825 [Gammaproteobacteria bacterium]|nr:hypothetical protein [Gammaproteobacteria bacterium]
MLSDRKSFNSGLVLLLSVSLSFGAQASGEGLQIGLSGTSAVGMGTVGDGTIAKLQAGGHDPKRNGFTVQNIELSLSAAVDPYWDAQSNIVSQISPDGESVFELEEAYFVSRALPLGLQLKGGQFYTEFGRHNPQHPHVWSFVDQPIIASRLLGGDGLRSQGGRLSWLAPLPWMSEFFVALQNANGETTHSFMSSGEQHNHGGEIQAEASFAEFALVDRPVKNAGDLLYSVRWLNGFDVGETLGANLGLSALYGPNNTGYETDTQILGADVFVKWQAQQSHRGFPFVAWHTEIMRRDYLAGDEGNTAHAKLIDVGMFSQLTWGFRQGWVMGLRYEWAQGNEAHAHDALAEEEIDPMRDKRQRMSTNLTYFPSEFSKVRLQYNQDHADHLGGVAHSFWLQIEYTIGAHMAHQF